MVWRVDGLFGMIHGLVWYKESKGMFVGYMVWCVMKSWYVRW